MKINGVIRRQGFDLAFYATSNPCSSYMYPGFMVRELPLLSLEDRHDIDEVESASISSHVFMS